ncbi:hypothetical protein FSB78_16675 [Sphingomonas ginsenosidivorax]|uniref:Uncharacterized protein n=1 Tax=Sphingomonas ginsenosidivorax TaxID=862135 RepID=A0A5C6UJI2_9SPHN|nr:hypothetical protein FSB78_16675 [Sphingomonas ginsenosidivorax]
MVDDEIDVRQCVRRTCAARLARCARRARSAVEILLALTICAASPIRPVDAVRRRRIHEADAVAGGGIRELHVPGRNHDIGSRHILQDKFAAGGEADHVGFQYRACKRFGAVDRKQGLDLGHANKCSANLVGQSRIERGARLRDFILSL